MLCDGLRPRKGTVDQRDRTVTRRGGKHACTHAHAAQEAKVTSNPTVHKTTSGWMGVRDDVGGGGGRPCLRAVGSVPVRWSSRADGAGALGRGAWHRPRLIDASPGRLEPPLSGGLSCPARPPSSWPSSAGASLARGATASSRPLPGHPGIHPLNPKQPLAFGGARCCHSSQSALPQLRHLMHVPPVPGGGLSAQCPATSRPSTVVLIQ